MTSHRLDPAPGTTRDVFSRDHVPVLTVDPGDTVTVGSLDASGHLARQRFPGEDQPKLIPGARGHCLTGPIEVRGARPGAVREMPPVLASWLVTERYADVEMRHDARTHEDDFSDMKPIAE